MNEIERVARAGSLRRRHMIEGARIALKHAASIASGTTTTSPNEYFDVIKSTIAAGIIHDTPATKLIDRYLGNKRNG